MDTEEGDEDIDGDGIKMGRPRLDGDDYYDVIEAGFKDKVLLDDEDGQLDDSPITMDSLVGYQDFWVMVTQSLDEMVLRKDYRQYGRSIFDAIINRSSLNYFLQDQVLS